jgi:uncharacterized protein YlxP (DUF503 family)
MFVGVTTFDLVLAENHSLKGKRQVLRKVKDRVRNSFNVSIAEVDALDEWQRATLAVSCVSRDRRHLESQLSRVVDFIDSLHLAVLENIETEVL